MYLAVYENQMCKPFFTFCGFSQHFFILFPDFGFLSTDIVLGLQSCLPWHDELRGVTPALRLGHRHTTTRTTTGISLSARTCVTYSWACMMTWITMGTYRKEETQKLSYRNTYAYVTFKCFNSDAKLDPKRQADRQAFWHLDKQRMMVNEIIVYYPSKYVHRNTYTCTFNTNTCNLKPLVLAHPQSGCDLLNIDTDWHNELTVYCLLFVAFNFNNHISGTDSRCFIFAWEPLQNNLYVQNTQHFRGIYTCICECRKTKMLLHKRQFAV